MDAVILAENDSEIPKGDELLDGMLEAAISIATEKHKQEIKEKNREIKRLERTSTDERAKFQEEKEEKRETQQRLARRDQAIRSQAAARANRLVSTGFGIFGFIIVAMAVAVLTSVIVEQPPKYVKWGAYAFTALGTIITASGLLGLNVVGLNVVAKRFARRIFKKRCLSLGISEEDVFSGTYFSRHRIYINPESLEKPE